MHPYRVFISYSHENYEEVKKIVAALTAIGLRPVWDESIQPGTQFSEIIKSRISHAHVFLPVLTKNSIKRPWVHQETGFAMGLKVPVVPLAVGTVPDHMLHGLHALKIDLGNIEQSVDSLGETIDVLLNPEPQESDATFRTARRPEDRAEMMARYTRQALLHNATGPLRQEGAISSFGLPKEAADDPVWETRDGKLKRSQFLYERLRDERLAFEEYARSNGCGLILDPTISFEENGPEGRKTRLTTLFAFLKDTTIKNVRVAIRPRLSPGSLTICGDWFTAESMAPRPGEGYFGTVFSWHAPTVWQKALAFDRELDRLLKQAGLTDESSREAAIQAVQEQIAGIM